jgi:aldose 1-epimerase
MFIRETQISKDVLYLLFLKSLTDMKSTTMKRIAFCLFILTLCFSGCKSQPARVSTIEDKIWGEFGGKVVRLFTLTNKNGMTIKVTNYGATLTYVSVPDKNGTFENVVLGFDSLKGYLGMNPLFGATVGRFANRIGGAKFSLYGTTYKLNAMGGSVAMHGGLKGFSRQVFEVDTAYSTLDSAVVVLRYTSPDMEEGYPGTLNFQMTYVLTGNNEVKLEYLAETDKPTVVNFTNHSYFNLTGCKDPVLNHELRLVADSITLTDNLQVPTGVLSPVAGTPFDFTQTRKIGEKIAEVAPGYDINYKLRKRNDELSLVAEVFEPVSGRRLMAYTTEPGVQFYTGNSLSDRITGHNGMKYGKYFGLCLEMQHFPDSPNKPQFPSVVLNPDDQYRQTTIYKFSVR